MKNNPSILLIIFIIIISQSLLIASSGDTIRVITHNHETVVTDPSTGNKPYYRWGVFPKPEVPIRKIIMKVDFACPDTMRCADWDYLDRISISRIGGVNGESLDYEIGRIITPYGGAFGKDWQFGWSVDVTDFSILLRDSVEINYNHSGYEPCNDRGWEITIEFEILLGDPVCEPISISKIYDDHFRYGDNHYSIEQKLSPVSFTADSKATFARLRVIQTGHGMDEPDGCGEFCDKYRELWYDGRLIDTKQIWKECGDNPLYPQAGTWIFDRANWCPGDLVQPEIFDLPVAPGTSHTIDFAMQEYCSPNPSADEVISAYLIQYKKNSAEYDISVEDVIVPSLKSVYKRLNPSGNNPLIKVKNNGSEQIENMVIEYGTAGFKKSQYEWTGVLPSNYEAVISLPGRISENHGYNKFNVSILKPNNKTDQYPPDNNLTVPFASTPVHDSLLIFNLLTNNEPQHNSYKLVSDNGNIVFERKLGTLAPKTVYTDTFKLSPGAYQIVFADTAGDGLEFWYNVEGGRGLARLTNTYGELIKSFESDCGSGWIYNFIVGENSDSINPDNYSIGLFPTRTSDFTRLDYFSNKPEDVIVRLTADPGGNIVEEHRYPQLKEGFFDYDLRRYPIGRFYLKVIVNGEEKFNKRIRYIENPNQNSDAYSWPSDSLVSENLHRWQDWKFGLLISWGAYSEWGIVESWSLCPEDEPWCVRRGEFADDYYQYTYEYEKLREYFNPVEFNPANWAEAAKNAGIKYTVFTTKHHDGFCMFDSKYTDYKITDSRSKFSSNPKSNIAKEIFSAFRGQGIKIGAYFSKPDWHSNDYWWRYFPVFDRNVNYNPEKYPDRWKNFQLFTFNQIEELMKDYGVVDILWLDGGWVRPAGTLTEETKPWLGKNQWFQDVNIPAIADMARKYQPGILIVDRTVHGEYENYRTPEQQIPESIPDYPWESCITLGDNWYSTGPGERYKSVNWVIHTLIKIVARGGNFLLGIGPDKTGELVPAVYERLAGVGEWMEMFGEAIYNTKPLPPYQKENLYFTQSKDEKIKYMLLLCEEGKPIAKSVELPAEFFGDTDDLHLLGNPKKLSVQKLHGKIFVEIPESLLDEFKSFPAIVFEFETRK